MEIEYDRKTQRYRWTENPSKGQFVSNQQVRALINKSIEQKKERVRAITQQLFDEEIKLSEWEKETAKLLKTTAIQNYAIGKPGDLSLKDYGRIGNHLRSQYGYLRKFSREIRTGKLSQARISARIELYFNKTRFDYESGHSAIHAESGYRWERRIKPARESCLSCIQYNDMGWQSIGTLPKPTQQCECQANCKCYFEFSKSREKPTLEILSSFGWIA